MDLRESRRRLPSLVESPETLGDALLGEWLEQVVDHTELEGEHRVTLERRREDEHRRIRRGDCRANEIEPRFSSVSSQELDVDEHGFDAHSVGGHSVAVFGPRGAWRGSIG